MKMLTLGVMVVALLSSVGGTCYEEKDCESCTYKTGYFGLSCSWCPLSDTCHTYGSFYNDCDGDFSISNESFCPTEALAARSYYNHTLAGQLASWASIAYAKPADIDPMVLTSVLENELPGKYRVLKFIQKYCEIMVHYSACSLFVAISDLEKNIIVSFEGTQNLDQLFEQLTSAIVTGLEDSVIGGKVLYYNSNVHHLLYPCLKDYLVELLAKHPGYRLMLTGHSLGGAQAQLAAAALVFDKVIPNDRMEVYTFGAPRFGDSDFANYFDKLVRNNWRLVQANDPVPRIPPYFVYHTHEEVWFSEPGVTAQSEYTVCAVNEDDACALSQETAICFTEDCVNIHKAYFLKDIGSEFSMGKLAGPNSPRTSILGTCDSVDFAEQ